MSHTHKKRKTASEIERLPFLSCDRDLEGMNKSKMSKHTYLVQPNSKDSVMVSWEPNTSISARRICMALLGSLDDYLVILSSNQRPLLG